MSDEDVLVCMKDERGMMKCENISKLDDMNMNRVKEAYILVRNGSRYDTLAKLTGEDFDLRDLSPRFIKKMVHDLMED